MSRELIDLVGQKFGKLTVIKRDHDYISPKGRREPQWVCECECGGTSIVSSSHLRRGHTKSCGCNRRRKKRSKDVGVYYMKRANRWIVNIRIGSFVNRDDAIEASKRARSVLFGAE